MKIFKFGILTAIMISLFLDIEASAEIIVNQVDKNGSSSRQNFFINRVKGSNDGKAVELDKTRKHEVEIKTEDEVTTMTWDAAVIAVKKYGEGWRLPSIAELRMMYDQRKLIGGFGDEDYWSSTEQDVNSAWTQGFRMGDQDRYNKQSKLKVRAVRSF